MKHIKESFTFPTEEHGDRVNLTMFDVLLMDCGGIIFVGELITEISRVDSLGLFVDG